MSNQQKTRLALFNEKWEQREALFARYAPLPFWGPGLILTDAIRSAYEHFLPVSEYAWDLASVLSDVLPGSFKDDAFSAWVPACLRQPPASLPDLWAMLPPPVSSSGGEFQPNITPTNSFHNFYNSGFRRMSWNFALRFQPE